MSQNVQSSKKLLCKSLSTKLTPTSSKEEELNYLFENGETPKESQCGTYENQQIFSSQLGAHSHELLDIELMSNEYELATVVTEPLNGSRVRELPLTSNSLEQIFDSKTDSFNSRNESFDTYYPSGIPRRTPSTSSSEQSCSDSVLHKLFTTDQERAQYIAAKRKKRVEKASSNLPKYKRRSIDLGCISSVKGLPSIQNKSNTSNVLSHEDSTLITKRNDILSLLELDEVYRTVKNSPSCSGNKSQVTKSSKNNFSTKNLSEISNISFEYSSKTFPGEDAQSLVDIISTNSSMIDSNTSILVDTFPDSFHNMHESKNFVATIQSPPKRYSRKSFARKSISETPSGAKDNILVRIPSISDEASTRKFVNLAAKDSSKVIPKGVQIGLISRESAGVDSDSKSLVDFNATNSCDTELNLQSSIGGGFNIVNSDIDSNSQPSIDLHQSRIPYHNSKESVNFSSTSSVDIDLKGTILAGVISKQTSGIDLDSKSSQDFIATDASDFDSNSKLSLDIHTTNSFDIESNSQSSVVEEFGISSSPFLEPSNTDVDSKTSIEYFVINPPDMDFSSSKLTPSASFPDADSKTTELRSVAPLHTKISDSNIKELDQTLPNSDTSFAKISNPNDFIKLDTPSIINKTSNLTEETNVCIKKSKVSELNLPNNEMYNNLDKIFNETSPRDLQASTFFNIESEEDNGVNYDFKTNQNIATLKTGLIFSTKDNETAMLEIAKEINVPQFFDADNKICNENNPFLRAPIGNTEHLIDISCGTALQSTKKSPELLDEIKQYQFSSLKVTNSRARKSCNSKPFVEQRKTNVLNACSDFCRNEEVCAINSKSNNEILSDTQKNHVICDASDGVSKSSTGGAADQNFNPFALLSVSQCNFDKSKDLTLGLNNRANYDFQENEGFQTKPQKSRKTFNKSTTNIACSRSIAKKSFTKVNIFTPDDFISCGFDRAVPVKKRKVFPALSTRSLPGSNHPSSPECNETVIKRIRQDSIPEIGVNTDKCEAEVLLESMEGSAQEPSNDVYIDKMQSINDESLCYKEMSVISEENMGSLLLENMFVEDDENARDNFGDGILKNDIQKLAGEFISEPQSNENDDGIHEIFMKHVQYSDKDESAQDACIVETENAFDGNISSGISEINFTKEDSCELVEQMLFNEEVTDSFDKENQIVINEKSDENNTKVTETMDYDKETIENASEYNEEDTNKNEAAVNVYSAKDNTLFDPSEMESTPNMRAAMKTFVKPFTAAKKSVAGEKAPNSTNCKKTALKTFANKQLNRRLYDASPNDIIKDGSAIYILKNSSANGSSCEEISEDDTKDAPGSWSLQELIHSKSFCSCSKDGVPCLFNGEPLQQSCEGEDTIDGNTLSCTRQVSAQSLLTPSSKVKYRTFCNIHLWRLKHHHCCPKCGTFCTQGIFLMCQCEHLDKGNDEIHLFHPECYLIPNAGLPPGCPHCCKFSNFSKVQLKLTDSWEKSNDSQVVSGSQNLTSHFNGYNLIMTTLELDNENTSIGAMLSIPEKQELESMLMAINSDKCLHLRPTGKCLYNPIKTGDVKKVLQLLVNGVNPNHKFKTHKNNTPLHIAAYFGFTGIVHILLQYGGLIDAINDDLETPLILAVERKYIAVVRYLIFAGAQIDAKTENGLIAFHAACKNGSKEMAQFLYDVGNFDINSQDDGGWTPLVWACEYKNLDVVVWLLELGADPNIRDSEENIALHWAACSGESEILDILLDNGCSLNFVNKRGDTAMHIAARKDHYPCVKLLMGRGALLDRKNEDGETPIMCCDEDSKSYRFLKKYCSLVSQKFKRTSLEHVVFRDISLGLEKYAIQVVNEVDSEEFAMNFRYVMKNCQTSNIQITTTVDSMEWCRCKSSCGTGDCNCTSVFKCWYDANGCLLSHFNIVDPPVIYECHKLCHCPKTCINRVVQKGLGLPLQLFRTSNRGWGVRCLKDLTKGRFVCEYVGELIQGSEIPLREDDSYIFDLSSKDGDYCIDGRFYGNVARFFNHNCEPNLIAVPVFMQHQDLNFPHIALFTSRDVPALEELCFDYGKEFWIAKSRAILCTCGTQSCKYSKDTIDDTLYEFLKANEANKLLPDTITLENTDIIYSSPPTHDVNKPGTNYPPTNLIVNDFEVLELPELSGGNTTEPDVLSTHIVDNEYDVVQNFLNELESDTTESLS